MSLQNPFTDSNNYLQMTLEVFPAGKIHFDQWDIPSLGFILSNQTFKPPQIFGPFYFMARQYGAFQGTFINPSCIQTLAFLLPCLPKKILVGTCAFHAVASSGSEKSSSTPTIIGAAAGAAALVLILIGVAFFAVKRMKKPEQNREQSQPFGKIAKLTSCYYIAHFLLLIQFSNVLLYS